MEFKMIFTICPNDHVDIIIDATKKAGATGATILSVRGTGHREATTFFGLKLDRPMEALMMVVEKQKCAKLMKIIYGVGQMKQPGMGICFSMPIESIEGLESQLSFLEKKTEDSL